MSNSNRRALVTGSTGFLGHALAVSLVRDGWSVHLLARESSDRARLAALESIGCRSHHCDGSQAAITRIVESVAPSCLWHLGAVVVSEHAAPDVVPMIRGNVEFGCLLLEALASVGAVPIVTAGSFWQQYENAEYSPVSLYAATKQAFDDLAVYYADVRGLTVIECMLTDTYGPNDTRPKLIAMLLAAEKSGNRVRMRDGLTVVDLLHVDDAVQALKVAAARGMAATAARRERWAVRPGMPLSVREVVERFSRVRGVTLHVDWGQLAARSRETTVPWTAGDVLPRWSPQTSLDDGFARLTL